MTELSEKFLNLEISEPIFQDIKYFISGEVHEKIKSLLKAGGAEHQNYITDYVTHLIVGNNPEENDISDANDLYEIPAVTPKWILMCVRLKRRLDPKPYIYPITQKLFEGKIFCFSQVAEDRNYLWGLITYNGGLVYNKLSRHCNYLVTGITNSEKFKKAESVGPENIKIVTADWILEAVKTNRLPDVTLFNPKLINWPKPPKPQESTTSITGFDPDVPENEEKNEEKAIPDSTQALLKQLKQSLPWNQPPTSVSTSVTGSSETIAPPNVVAPSFLSKLQHNQNTQNIRPAGQQISISQSSMLSGFSPGSSQSNNQMSRSLVHHSLNNQNQQTVLQQNLSRLIGNSSARPTTLQSLKGQVNTYTNTTNTQIHQQLLQQRIQQQNQQNIIQRSSTGQLNVNQQLLHQQLSQGQRQVLQNHLMGQQGLISQQLLNQQTQGQSQLVDSQTQSSPTLVQQNQQCSPSNQQNLLNQQNQLNQQMQVQNQVLGIQQQNQQQMSQQQNQLQINQQNQMQINPQQNQLQQQQNQQLQNQLLSQNQGQNQQNILNQQNQQNSLLGQNQQSQLLNQNQIINQSSSQIQQNQLINQAQNQLINQPQVSMNSHLLNQVSSQKQLINSHQTQHQLMSHQNQIINQQLQQNQLLTQQNSLLSQSQQNQLLNQPNQFINQQNQLINQQNSNPVSQSSQIINQNQVINQQTQQIINQEAQHQTNQQAMLNLPNMSQNQHLNQLSSQQIQQLQQLKREQLLNQNQSQNVSGLSQGNISLNQQRLANQNQNQQLLSQNQQLIGQPQLLQNNRVIQQQNINQPINQNFGQQGLGQHIISQKQLLVQQQINTSQHQQLQIQNQGQLTTPQFVNQSQFENIQQKLNQNGQNQLNQATINQMNVQALNQQLNSQNLGQQLNQQLLQQNQQSSISQGNINQQNMNQAMGLDQGINQNIGVINQQTNLNQPGLNAPPTLGQTQSVSQQNQMNQINAGINQQVIRGQFTQQMLVNQAQQNPQATMPRPQLSQQPLWAQQQQQGTQIQGQQIIRHPVNVAVQQSSASANVGPRLQWPPGQQTGIPQRQLIHLDAQTHNQLQKMPPEQQALFVARLQKQRQLQLAKQVQQRAGGQILIRGNVPPGLTAQQQVQWLQQQAKQQGIVLPPNLQQNITPAPQQGTSTQVPQSPHAPSLSPINQNPGQQFVGDQAQLRQYKLQQLQLQREQAQKNHLNQQSPLTPQPAVRPLGQPTAADSTTNPQVQVNPKTKTALANMLSIKLQSGGTIGATPRPEGLPEQSAAGTLRMMTAQHNAAINSKPQEIIALQHRRVISGPNGEIIKPPGVSSLPLTPQNEPPKLQFNQKPAIPVQHRAGPFYGHNPNLKLPPDLFLLGCIFVVVEVEEYLEQNLAGWQQKIEKYGGEVEKQYCSRVTHVLCETQRHGVVMQALRDLKRCVTIRWLSDVIKTKQVLPPWTALHLPQIYLDITPASKHLISISGFEGNIRQIVKQMIRYTGAKCTTYFSKHNTLLICAKAEGKKFNHAKKWGIPVVNVQWLTDIILGNFTAMNQMDNQIYQTYSNPPNLNFDPKLVPNMMHAWKAPINISQELYERVKRSASPVLLPKPKKLKTEHTDENENITEEIPNSPYKVMFSQFEAERVKELEKNVRELGGCVSKDYKDFTHLVVPKLGRTHKLLFAITKSCYIVTYKWIEDSFTARMFLPENDFIPPMDEFNKTYNVSLERTLQVINRNKIFEGKIFWITPSVFPTKKIVCELIEACGGRLERIRRSKAQIEASNATSPLTYFIIISKEDLHLVADLLKHKKEKQRVVCNVELVLSAILKQHFEIDPYTVSVV
ncbi:uncharacterized protein LOC143192843 isoform X2 [Rhynchophorus ferrugineus]|uniref:uncharacterized protein LOC143192843 isoform X2 n=1 Tax=Rhynchophorus ferrugineus TaxID=354439 RepID=UPI003FCD4C0B